MKSIRILPICTWLLVWPTLPVVSAVLTPEVMEQCKGAADFKGCAEVLMNGVPATSSDSELLTAMKKVSARLRNGTNLRDSDEVFRPLVDALATVPDSEQNSSNYKRALVAEKLFGIAQSTWQLRIDSMKRLPPNYPEQWFVKSCKQLKMKVSLFNTVAGEKLVSWSWRKRGIFGLCEWNTNPEVLMVRSVADLLIPKSENSEAGDAERVGQ